ncbi:MAG TPA: nuclear transport factor 2 family protein, partial [Burkholderiaceae bacterium]|nr:nuclear transport factor 2 family protein [Burkholderiaceae bacterium]
MPAQSLDPRTARLVQAYEALSPATLPALMQRYDEAARFKDPFNEVQGVPAIQAIFAHMFEALEQPRFVVTGRVVQGT